MRPTQRQCRAVCDLVGTILRTADPGTMTITISVMADSGAIKVWHRDHWVNLPYKVDRTGQLLTPDKR